MTATTLSTPLGFNDDLSIVDARAPRFNQTTVALLSIVALITGAWPLLTLLALQLGISVTLGRKYCLPCVIYFRFVQPRFGPGPVEDSRAPRFANILGFIFLGSASLAYAVGLTGIGFGLGAMVAVLATLAATTGLCVGCEAYRLLARFRGVRGGNIERVDLAQLQLEVKEGTVVLFTHPLCSDCTTLSRSLETTGQHVVKIDVSKHRSVAKKYGVSVVPLAFRVDASGRVLGEVH